MNPYNTEFIRGHTYKVVKAFTKFSENFRQGQIVRLVDEGYSRYDGLRIYAFEDLENGYRISLEITDSENFNDWRAMFEDF